MNFLKLLLNRKNIILALSLVAFFLVAIYSYSYFIDRFNPQSRINFDVYSPNGEQRNRQLIIGDYLQGSFNPFVVRNSKVITNDPQGESRIITEQKASDLSYVCDGSSEGCSVRQTAAGQRYVYIKRLNARDSSFTDEQAHFEKNGTDIIIDRNTYTDRPMSSDDWNKYIDSFQKVPSSQLETFFFIGDKQVSFGA
jgi:hypothetical protein